MELKDSKRITYGRKGKNIKWNNYKNNASYISTPDQTISLHLPHRLHSLLNWGTLCRVVHVSHVSNFSV